MQTNCYLFLITFCISFTTFSQKKIQEDYYLPTGKRSELQLSDLVKATNDITYRFWINPDLIIEVDDDVNLTLYTTSYDKIDKSYKWFNVEKYQLQDVNTEDLISYLDSINLSEWRYNFRSATETISDGNRITIEHSTANSYRIFYLHEPMVKDLSLAQGTLELLNYLDSEINIDSIRLKYYQGLIESTESKKVSRNAKNRIKRIEHYSKNYQKIWKKMNFPTMYW